MCVKGWAKDASSHGTKGGGSSVRFPEKVGLPLGDLRCDQ